MRKVIALLLSLIMLDSCTSVYVQTGDGSIERSVDVERSVGKTRSKDGTNKDSGTDVQR